MVAYTKEMLDIMTVLRRRLKAEFDIVIRFSSTDALDTIYDLARRSADSTTKKQALTLLTLSGRHLEPKDLTRPTHQSIQHKQQQPESPKPKKSVRIYRGKVIA